MTTLARPPRAPERRPHLPAEVRQRLVSLLVTDIHPDPDSPREDVGDVTELAESIAAVGLIEPIVVRITLTGRLVVLAGARRLEAHRLLGRLRIDAVIRRDVSPAKTLAIMVAESSQRVNLNPVEEARAVRKLMRAHRLTQPDVGRILGRSDAWVARRLLLLALDDATLRSVASGEVPLREAEQLAAAAPASRRPKAVAPTGRTVSRGWDFDSRHTLAETARARCSGAGHSPGRHLAGGVACGRCWEAVIREDERATPGCCDPAATG